MGRGPENFLKFRDLLENIQRETDLAKVRELFFLFNNEDGDYALFRVVLAKRVVLLYDSQEGRNKETFNLFNAKLSVFLDKFLYFY